MNESKKNKFCAAAAAAAAFRLVGMLHFEQHSSFRDMHAPALTMTMTIDHTIRLFCIIMEIARCCGLYVINYICIE